MPSYLILLYIITPFLSDTSKQGSLSICLFAAVRNLQQTFLYVNLEGLKSQRFSGPLALTMADPAADVVYMSVPNFSNFNFDCFKYEL